MRKGAEKLSKYLNAKQQGRLDGFFTAQPKTSPKKDKDDGKGKGKGTKRKVRSSHLLSSLAIFNCPLTPFPDPGRHKNCESKLE